jgi:Flp pilus assembly protein TadD
MMNRTFSTMMTSAVVLGSLMVGCSGGGQDRPKLAVNDPQSFAPKIERMLAEKDYAQALTAAEQLVAADPQNGNARAILARAYLASGRYISARIAFTDAMTLGNRDPRTIVSLSLTESGLGDLQAAHTLLADHIADLPAADYGLAMTMAGDPREGVRALLEAAQAPEATAKTRQNLAYALAMAGAWGQARLVAGQDLSARDAEARIGEWTQTFSQGTPSDRVVAMLGVSPRTDDAGLPVQLALNASQPEAQPVQLASAADLVKDAARDADPVPAAAPVEAAAPAPIKVAELKLAEAKPAAPVVIQAAPAKEPVLTPAAIAAVLAKPPVAPVSLKPAEQLETVDRTEPTLGSASPVPAALQKQGPVAQSTLKVAFTPAAVAAPSPAAKPLAPVTPQQVLKHAFTQPSAHTDWAVGLGKPATKGKASDWVVQLGAFDSPALAKSQWSKLSQSRAPLKAYSAVHSTVQVNGRTFYRLAIRGFETRGAASTTCGSLRTSGQDCFVRLDDKGAAAPAQAAAPPERASGRVRASR